MTQQAPVKGTITVYVRKGIEDHERTLAFAPPPELSSDDLLDMGLAIDGRDAIGAVTPDVAWETLKQVGDGKTRGVTGISHYEDDYQGPRPARSLHRALAEVQQGLRAMLAELGYRVVFK